MKLNELLEKKALVIVSSGETEKQVPGAILDRIARRPHELIPWLAEAAIYLRVHGKHIETAPSFVVKRTARDDSLDELLGLLKSEGLIRDFSVWPYDQGRYFCYSVLMPQEDENQKFFRSRWAEAYFRRLAKLTLRSFCNQVGKTFEYKFLSNVKVARKGEEGKLIDELDLVLEIGGRIYLFEIKSGPRVNVCQWAKRVSLYDDNSARIMVCSSYPEIPVVIFEPQILLTVEMFSSSLMRFLESDLGVATVKSKQIDELWKSHDRSDLGLDLCGDPAPDSRTLSQRLNEDFFHMRRNDDGCRVVIGHDGQAYDDYGLNAEWD